MAFVNKEKGELARAVVRKLISEFGSEIEENEKLVAFRVEAIVENDDHKALKGFSQGMFEIRMTEMRLHKLVREMVSNMAKAAANGEDTVVGAFSPLCGDDDDES